MHPRSVFTFPYFPIFSSFTQLAISRSPSAPPLILAGWHIGGGHKSRMLKYNLKIELKPQFEFKMADISMAPRDFLNRLWWVPFICVKPGWRPRADKLGFFVLPGRHQVTLVSNIPWRKHFLPVGQIPSSTVALKNWIWEPLPWRHLITTMCGSRKKILFLNWPGLPNNKIDFFLRLTPLQVPQQWSRSRLQSWRESGHQVWWFWTEKRGAWRHKLVAWPKPGSCLSFETSQDRRWCGACRSGRWVHSRRCLHFCTGLNKAPRWKSGPEDARWSWRAPSK